MNRVCGLLVEWLLQALEPDEREVVRGDLIEAGESASQALSGVAGLVLRRQAALWKDWQPWAVFILLTLPLGMLLSVAARLTGNSSATYAWLYLGNWDWALLKYAEFWYELRDTVVFLATGFFALACWSWTAGFVMGSVSRRIVAANAVLFGLTLVPGAMLAPRYLAVIFQYPTHGDPTDVLIVYRDILPWVLEFALVLAPCIWGIREGAGVGRLPGSLRALIWAAAVMTLIEMLLRQPGVGRFLRAYDYPMFWRPWASLGWVAYWPAVFVIGRSLASLRSRIHI